MSELPKANTRERILTAALDLFAQNGYSATSIRQIAHNVGVRESSIYNHFQNKDDILKTVLSSYGFGFIKTTLEKNYMNMEIKDPKNFLRTIIDDTINRWQEPEDSKFVRVLFMEVFREPAAREAYQRDLDASRDFFVQLFEKMEQKGMIRPADPWVLANEFLGIIMFIHFEYLNQVLDGCDVTRIYQYVKYKHVDFFWDAVKVKE